MGHATAIIHLSLDELPEKVTASAVMDAAVSKWRDEEAERWSDARQGYPGFSPLVSRETAEHAIYKSGTISDGVSKIVPLTDDYSEKTSTVRLQVTAKELEELRRNSIWELLDAGRFGEDAVKVEIDSLPKLRAPRAEATPGKAVTSYRITDGRGRPFEKPFGQEHHSALSMSYPTQAAARAAAIEHMAANPKISSLAVEAFVQRDTGSAALVTITRPEPESATASFKVTTQKPKASAKVHGYLIAFDYHF